MSNGWTIETIKEHFEKLLAEKDKAINLALAAAKEAVGVAEKNAEKWRDNANEWRGAMVDRENKFMGRSEFIAYKESTERALAVQKERGDKGEGRGEVWGKFAGWIAAIVIALLSYFLKK
jgi:hypothetical protein